jgi:hypothetical protein
MAPPPPPPKLGRRQTGSLRKRDNLLMGEWGGAKAYDGEKAWSSINHTIFSELVGLHDDIYLALFPGYLLQGVSCCLVRMLTRVCAQVSQVTRALTCLLANNEDMSSLYLTQAGRRVEEHQGTVYTRFES